MNKAKELANIFGVEELQTFYLKNDEETQLKYRLAICAVTNITVISQDWR